MLEGLPIIQKGYKHRKTHSPNFSFYLCTIQYSSDWSEQAKCMFVFHKPTELVLLQQNTNPQQTVIWQLCSLAKNIAHFGTHMYV